jgi:hypothetical protein
MATEIALRTFEDILNEIIRRGKIETSIDTVNEDHLTALKGFVNTHYQEIAYARTWNWREESRLLELTPKYTAGTASVTNASRAVTLSASASIIEVTDNFVGRYFQVDGDTQYYEIISVDTTNRVLYLAASYIGTTNAAATYKIFRSKYGLWPDFADLYDIRLWGTITNNPLGVLTTEEYGNLTAKFGPGEGQYPTHYYIGDQIAYSGPTMGANFIMGYDFMGSPNNLSLAFYPMILSQKIVEVKYGKQVQNLVEDTDEPLIPRDKRLILVYGALMDWFATQRNETAQAIWKAMYDETLRKMKADFDKTVSRPKLVAINPYKRRSPSLPIRFITTED